MNDARPTPADCDRVPSSRRAGALHEDRLLTRPMRVVARGRGWMRLQGERETACSSCAAKSGCGVNAISDVLNLAPPTIAVASASPAEIGEEVEVSIPGGVFLRAAMLAYLLPPAALVSAAAIADSAGLSGGLTALAAVAAFGLSLLPIRALDRDGRLLDAVTTNTEKTEFTP